MSLEPFAGIFVSVFGREHAVLMELLQDAVPRTEPRAYGCNVQCLMLAKLMFPHLVRDKLPVRIEMFNLGAEEADKVDVGFARQHTARLGIVIHTDLSDE